MKRIFFVAAIMMCAFNAESQDTIKHELVDRSYKIDTSLFERRDMIPKSAMPISDRISDYLEVNGISVDSFVKTLSKAAKKPINKELIVAIIGNKKKPSPKLRKTILKIIK